MADKEEPEKPEEPEDPTLEDGALDRIYEELGDLGVHLDPDPLAFGPKHLNGKIADVRAQLDRCESIFLQTSHDLHRFNTTHRRVATRWQVEKDWLLANDPETRAGRNVSTQEAVANVKLAGLVTRAHKLGAGVEDLKAALVVIKAKRADLKDAASRLRDQIKLCQEEIGLGSTWGSKKPNAPELTPSGTVPEVDRIDDVLGDIGGETHLSELKDEPQEPVLRAPAHAAEPDDKPEPVAMSPWGVPSDQEVDDLFGTTLVPEPDPPPSEKEKIEDLTSLLKPNATENEVDDFLSLELEVAKSPARTGISEQDLDAVLDLFD